MGFERVLIGGMLGNDTAKAAPFDVRYLYLHSRPAPFQACYSNCWDGCNKDGWWGCWGTWNQSESGVFVTWWNEYVAKETWQGQPRPQMHYWTWYSLQDLAIAANPTGSPDYKGAIASEALLKAYMDDYRFFLKKIGTDTRAMVHLEPDFWGFVRGTDNDPHKVKAVVRAANPADCGAEEDSAAGLASCLIAMVRKYAPLSSVGLHVSCWDYDRPGGPKGCADYMRGLGAAKGDFIVTDAADRDAAWATANDSQWGHLYWWNDDKFRTYVDFIKTMTEGVGKPMVIWQIPLGNMDQANTLNHWKDNKVDYMFNRIDSLADAHVAALLFGAGHHEQTSPETDGGYLIRRTNDYFAKGGVPLR